MNNNRLIDKKAYERINLYPHTNVCVNYNPQSEILHLKSLRNVSNTPVIVDNSLSRFTFGKDNVGLNKKTFIFSLLALSCLGGGLFGLVKLMKPDNSEPSSDGGHPEPKAERYYGPQTTQKNEDIHRDVVSSKLDFSCIEERQISNVSQVLRTYGQVLEAPVTQAAQDIHTLSNVLQNQSQCPDTRYLQALRSTTKKLDDVLNGVLSTLPGGKTFFLTRFFGNSLKLLADAIDNRPLDDNEKLTALDALNIESGEIKERSEVYRESGNNEAFLSEQILRVDGKTQLKIDHKLYPLEFNTESKSFIKTPEGMREVYYSPWLKLWMVKTETPVEMAKLLVDTQGYGEMTLSEEAYKKIVSTTPLDDQNLVFTYPDENGVREYESSPEVKLGHAIKVDNKYYPLTYEQSSGKLIVDDVEMQKVDDFLLIPRKSEESDIEWLPCRLSRSPGESACIFNISTKLNSQLQGFVGETFFGERLRMVPDRRYSGVFKDRYNERLYLKYKGSYYLLKPTSEIEGRFTIFGRKAGQSHEVADIVLIKKSGVTDILTSLEHIQSSVGFSENAAKMYEFIRKAGKFTLELEANEKNALRGYGNLDYDAINDAMRNDINLSGPDASSDARLIFERIELIRSALEKIPPFKGTVYRGGIISSAIVGSLRIGDFVSNKSFLSTSADKKVAFYNIPERRAGITPVLLKIIPLNSAHPILFYTFRINEAEALISDNTIFRITKIINDSDYAELTLEEVAPQIREDVLRNTGVKVNRVL